MDTGTLIAHVDTEKVSLCFLVAAVVAGALVRKDEKALNSGKLTLNGHRLDSLNTANLTRRVTTGLIVQEATHVARIDGTNLALSMRYKGYCNEARASAIDFSIDLDNNTPFEQLECIAFDLCADPLRRNPIKPLLVSADGISKKIAAPFLDPLDLNQRFEVQLDCRLPDCMPHTDFGL